MRKSSLNDCVPKATTFRDKGIHPIMKLMSNPLNNRMPKSSCPSLPTQRHAQVGRQATTQFTTKCVQYLFKIKINNINPKQLTFREINFLRNTNIDILHKYNTTLTWRRANLKNSWTRHIGIHYYFLLFFEK